MLHKKDLTFIKLGITFIAYFRLLLKHLFKKKTLVKYSKTGNIWIVINIYHVLMQNVFV